MSVLETVQSLIDDCHRDGIPLVQIRYRPLTYEQAADGGDYDFLLARNYHSAFFKALFVAFSSAAIPFLIDQRKPDKTVIQVFDAEHDLVIKLELWCALELKDPEHRTIGRIWAEDLGSAIVSADGRYALASGFEALYYLTHLYTKKKSIQASQVQERMDYYRQRITADPEVTAIFDRLESQQDIAPCAAAAVHILLARGYARSATTPANRFGYLSQRLAWYVRRLRMRFSAKGNVIAFVGPDGVGKTTIIREYKQLLGGRVKYYRFKKLFRGALTYQLLYPLLKRMALRRNPASTEKNQVDEIYGAVLFIIARARYFTLSVRRLWQTLLLTDRYFYDFLVTGLRFNDQKAEPRPYYEWLLRLTPTARCIVQLDANNSVIHSRKAELSSTAIDFIRQFTFRCYRSRPAPFYIYLNTGLPLDSCLNALRKLSASIGVCFHGFDLAQADTDSAGALRLTEDAIIGSGHERYCFQHPDDAARCIKVSRLRDGGRRQNEIDYSYFNSLARRGVPFDHLPQIHGWITTSHGRGLIFDKVHGPNGGNALTLDNALRKGAITCAEAKTLLDELYAYLQANALVFSDASLANIALGSTEGGADRLYVIDGLGARHYGLKLWLHEKLLWLARRKLRKQWPVILRQLYEHCRQPVGNS